MVRIDRNLSILNLQPGEPITEGHKIIVLRRVKTNYPAWRSGEGRGISVVILERETIGKYPRIMSNISGGSVTDAFGFSGLDPRGEHSADLPPKRWSRWRRTRCIICTTVTD